MTKEQRSATISALLEEKRGYQVRALQAEEDGQEEVVAAMNERAKAVEAELKKLGAGAQKRSQAAAKR